MKMIYTLPPLSSYQFSLISSFGIPQSTFASAEIPRKRSYVKCTFGMRKQENCSPWLPQKYSYVTGDEIRTSFRPKQGTKKRVYRPCIMGVIDALAFYLRCLQRIR